MHGKVRIIGTERKAEFTARGNGAARDLSNGAPGARGFIRVDGHTISGYLDSFDTFVPTGDRRFYFAGKGVK